MAANRIAIAFTFGVFLLNLLLGSWEAPATGDGYEEIRLVREGRLPRPQHLLLTPAWRALHQAVTQLAPGTTPLRTIVVANAACGAIALGLAFSIGASLGIGARALATALGGLAVSSAWWMHARDPETTMLSHALLVASVWALMQGRVLRNRGRMAAVALFTLAVSMAANLLTTMPMLVLLERWRSARPWHHPRTILFALALVLPFFGLATWCYAAHREEIAAPFFVWLTHHSSEQMMGAISKGTTPAAALRAGSGLLRTFLPLEGGVPAAAKLVLTGRSVQGLHADQITVFAIAAAMTAFVLVLFVRAALKAAHRSVFQAFAAGFLGTAGGCWIWLGSDPQFWVPILPFAFLGAAAGWKTLQSRTSYWMAAAALASLGLLFLANVTWPTPSLVHRQGGPPWWSAGEFCKTSTPGDLLVAQDSRWSFYVAERCAGLRTYRLLYESDATGNGLMTELEETIDATLAAGRRVVVEDLCADPGLEHLGFWENMALVKEVPREEICARLSDRYRIEELEERGQLRLLELKQRS
jgi:MFS family permease